MKRCWCGMAIPAVCAVVGAVFAETVPKVGEAELEEAVAQRSVVLSWNSIARAAVAAERDWPPSAARRLAMLHLAMHASMPGYGELSAGYPGLDGAELGAGENAANAAAFTVLLAEYPGQEEAFADLRDFWAARSEGEAAAGSAVGEKVLALRSEDGATSPVVHPGGFGPGEWRPTRPGFRPALQPQFALVTPFSLESPDQFRPPPPPDLDSEDYALALAEVAMLGEFFSPDRTADQTEIARYWADLQGTELPPGHFNRIAAQLVAERSWSVEREARFFAVLNMALADAVIATWDAKYHYSFWRPENAIRETPEQPIPQWTPLLDSPPFPEYPSGHAAFGGAAAEVLAHWFAEETSFAVESRYLPSQFGIENVTRSWQSFTAMSREGARSRIYGGIHFDFSDREGRALGRAAAAWTLDSVLAELPAGRVGWVFE